MFLQDYPESALVIRLCSNRLRLVVVLLLSGDLQGEKVALFQVSRHLSQRGRFPHPTGRIHKHVPSAKKYEFFWRFKV